MVSSIRFYRFCIIINIILGYIPYRFRDPNNGEYPEDPLWISLYHGTYRGGLYIKYRVFHLKH